MSTAALQRVIVRLMIDERFARRVAARPEEALRQVDLTSDERGWLLAADPRAFRSDPLFAPRLLHGVVGECAVSSAMVVATSRGGSRALLPFFHSDRLHRCIQAGDSLALAYADWLVSRVVAGSFGDPRIAEVARLEKALGQLRRAGESPGALTDRVMLVRTRVNTWSVYGQGLGGLRSAGEPTDAALRGSLAVRELPRLGAGHEWVLCRTTERDPRGQAELEVLPGALAALVALAADGATRVQVRDKALALGADADEAEGIISGLEADGILSF